MNNICNGNYNFLQKYCSSLKYLTELQIAESIFDDITRVDSFFAEFRNITFVMQKLFSSEELKKYYLSKRDEILVNNRYMRWAIDSRNAVTKEAPFALEKIVIVNCYAFQCKEAIYTEKITIDNDYSLDHLIKKLTSIFLVNNIPICYFSVDYVYRENKQNELDVYDTILSLVNTMNHFVLSVVKDNPCNCDKCQNRIQKINEYYISVSTRKISFIYDCVFENGVITFGSRAQFIMLKDGNVIDQRKLRISFSNDFVLRGLKVKDIFQVYYNFSKFHVHCYKEQDLDFMTTFIILFSDDTYSIESFVSTSKTTLYRKISEIAQLVDSQKKDIEAVFFAGEVYLFRTEDYISVYEQNYNERVQSAFATVLLCSLISKKHNSIFNMSFDSNMVAMQDLNLFFDKIKPKVESLDLHFLRPILNSMK
jgi:hypothetical protein